VIGKITRGARPGDIGRYLHGEGHLGEHEYLDADGRGRVGGVVIGGNLAREGDTDEKRWAADLRLAAAGRPEAQRPIWHVSLRCAPQDRRLSDAEWRDAVQEIASRMGWDQQPHVIVRHADDHVHVVMSRVAYDGSIWVGKNDARRLQEARQSVEKRMGLVQVPTRSRSSSREAAEGRLSAGEYRRSLKTGQDPERVRLAGRVEACVKAAEGMGREVFEQALQRAGIEYEANVASTGRVSGYRFHLPGHTDAAGEGVWFKASQLDRSLSWNKVAVRIETLEQVRVEPIEAAPKKLLESRTSYEQRQADAQRATKAAEQQAVQAKREQRLQQAERARPNLGEKIRASAGATQRAEAYRQKVKERRQLLETIGRARQLREPEGGWTSLRQLDRATKQRSRADAQPRTRADAQGRKRAPAPSLTEYQARQRRTPGTDPSRGRSR